MRPNDLSPIPGSTHKKKRVGRGNSSGHGTTSGRGTKGQQSRTGVSIPAWFEGGQIPLVRALSRKRGFNNKWRVEYEPVNVEALGRYDAGTKVDVAMLRESGLVKSARMPVKVLGTGDLGVKLTVEAHRFSAGAREKIEAAGGSVIELSPRPAEDEEPKGKKAMRRAKAIAGASRTAAATADEPSSAQSENAPAATSAAAGEDESDDEDEE